MLHVQSVVFGFVVREEVFSCFVGVVATAMFLAVLQYARGKRGRRVAVKVLSSKMNEKLEARDRTYLAKCRVIVIVFTGLREHSQHLSACRQRCFSRMDLWVRILVAARYLG